MLPNYSLKRTAATGTRAIMRCGSGRLAQALGARMEATAILLASSFGGVAGFTLGLLFLPSKHELLVGSAVNHSNRFLQAIYRRRSKLLNALLAGLSSLAILFCLVLASLFFLRAVGYGSSPAPTVAIFALPIGALGGYLVRSRLWQRYSSHLTIRSTRP